jgi:hypothetical protein
MKIHKIVTDKVGVPDDPSWNVPRWLQEVMNVDSCCRSGSSRLRLSLCTFLFFFLSNKVPVHVKCRGLFGVIMFV